MQIEYVIGLVDISNKANIIYWLSIKYKIATKSILALELYVMVHGFDVRPVIKSITMKIFDIKLFADDCFYKF